MGYANPKVRATYGFTIDHGVAADVATSFKGPKGLTGKIREITSVASEVFTAGGLVKIGTTGDDGAYANFALGTLAATDTLVATAQSGALIDEVLPADTQIEIVFAKVTLGASGTGIADHSITVDWF